MTLLEVMIALAILAFGLLAMLAMQIHAMRGGKVGRHYTRASRIASDQIETLHRFPWANVNIQPTGGWTLPTVVTDTLQVGGAVQQEQSYSMIWRITNDPINANLRQIDVQVTWREMNDAPAPAPPRRYAVSAIRYND